MNGHEETFLERWSHALFTVMGFAAAIFVELLYDDATAMENPYNRFIAGLMIGFVLVLVGTISVRQDRQEQQEKARQQQDEFRRRLRELITVVQTRKYVLDETSDAELLFLKAPWDDPHLMMIKLGSGPKGDPNGRVQGRLQAIAQTRAALIAAYESFLKYRDKDRALDAIIESLVADRQVGPSPWLQFLNQHGFEAVN